MSGFPGDFSEDVGETQEMIDLETAEYETELKRKLTALEREYVRLSCTVCLQDEADEFRAEHPNLFK
jgi:hypothetical protein